MMLGGGLGAHGDIQGLSWPTGLPLGPLMRGT